MGFSLSATPLFLNSYYRQVLFEVNNLFCYLRISFSSYRINRKTDPKRQFSVDEYGNVKIAHTLDREEIPAYNLLIEAFDTGNELIFCFSDCS